MRFLIIQSFSSQMHYIV